jgi:hypothetical protein
MDACLQCMLHCSEYSNEDSHIFNEIFLVDILRFETPQPQPFWGKSKYYCCSRRHAEWASSCSNRIHISIYSTKMASSAHNFPGHKTPPPRHGVHNAKGFATVVEPAVEDVLARRACLIAHAHGAPLLATWSSLVLIEPRLTTISKHGRNCLCLLDRW